MFVPLGDDNGRGRFPAVTLALIATNSGMFVVQASIPSPWSIELLLAAGAIPSQISGFSGLAPFTILSSLFLHGSVEHLLGNAWFLWLFGRRVEGAMGHLRFLGFYLLAGVLAGIVQVVLTPQSPLPIVGASGAIAGVLGSYLVLYPRARIRVLLFLMVVSEIVKVPAFMVLGIWFLWQVLGGGHGSIAVGAHIGGFLAGLALCKLFECPREDVRPIGPPWILTGAENSLLPP